MGPGIVCVRVDDALHKSGRKRIQDLLSSGRRHVRGYEMRENCSLSLHSPSSTEKVMTFM